MFRKRFSRSKRPMNRIRKAVPKSVTVYVKKEIKKEERKEIISVNTLTWAAAGSGNTFAAGASYCRTLLNPAIYMGGATNSRDSGSIMTTLSGTTPYDFQTSTTYRMTDYLKFRSMHLRIHGYTPSTQMTRIRVLIVLAKMNRGSAVALENILLPSATYGTIASVYNTNAVDWAKRYTIMYDKVHVVNADQTPAYSANNLTNLVAENPSYFIEIKKKLNIVTNYGLGNSGAVADIDDGALYLYCLSDTNSVSSCYITSQMVSEDYNPRKGKST